MKIISVVEQRRASSSPVPEVSVMAGGTLLAREATITCIIDDIIVRFIDIMIMIMMMWTNQEDICTPPPPGQAALLRLDQPQCPSSPESIGD